MTKRRKVPKKRKGLIPSRYYDLVSAVRGPDEFRDSNREALKWEVTARIRAILFASAVESRGDYNDLLMTNDDVLHVQCAAAAILDDPFGDHFINHLRKAVSKSEKHRIWGGLGAKLH